MLLSVECSTATDVYSEPTGMVGLALASSPFVTVLLVPESEVMYTS